MNRRIQILHDDDDDYCCVPELAVLAVFVLKTKPLKAHKRGGGMFQVDDKNM